MNRLVIIGNGFDMAHGFKTSYMDFINWYWDQRVYTFSGNTTNTPFVIAKIAELKEITAEEVERVTEENAGRLFTKVS